MGALESFLGMSWVLLKSWFLEAKAAEVKRRLEKRCRKLWLRTCLPALVSTANRCAGGSSKGREHVINSPEKLGEERESRGDSKARFPNKRSFCLNQWYIMEES